MADKDAQSILLNAIHGRLDSNDRYKGKPVTSVIEVALDALIEQENEIKRLRFLLRKAGLK